MRKGSLLVENLISLLIILIAILIGISIKDAILKGYTAFRDKYVAQMTAENVLFILAVDGDVPSIMNGFPISYTKEASKIHIKVGKYSFKYEVNFGK